MSGGKMIRKLLILLCLLTLMLNGCASEKTKQTAAQENDTEEDSGEKKIQIGLTVDSFVIERWIRDRDVFVATARELGAEVNVQDAGADTKEQISQIDYFIKKHMDLIVIPALWARSTASDNALQSLAMITITSICFLIK